MLASALLGEDPPELPVAHLVHLAGLFGINDNRARVALSRMVAAGEATTDGTGRYRLAGHLLDRLGRQTGSRRGETRPWQGAWRLVVVTTSGLVGRGAVGPAQAAGPGPAGRAARGGLAATRQHRPGARSGRRPRRRPCSPPRPTATPVALAAGLWDLARVGPCGPGTCSTGWTRLPPTGPADLAPGFELSAAVLRHLQADPLLPAELLPDGLARRRVAAGPTNGGTGATAQVLTTWGRSALTAGRRLDGPATPALRIVRAVRPHGRPAGGPHAEIRSTRRHR